MHDSIDMSIWQGRIDDEEATLALRWHQMIVPLDEQSWRDSTVVLGFSCDEGVKRNKGRIGASDGPGAIRKSLANLSYEGHHSVYDAGDVVCLNGEMEAAQAELARSVSSLLGRDMNVTVLGGGHEIAWGSFQGIVHHLRSISRDSSKVGIINFDAHLDLRNPVNQTSSGTPFREIAQWCQAHDREFHYHVIGVNRAANTSALFDYAEKMGVSWVEDIDVQSENITHLGNELEKFISGVDYLYLTVCLDVFASSIAPGVSAPAAVGVQSGIVIRLIRKIQSLGRELGVPIILSDVAEMNPHQDFDERTARLAARLVWEMART